MGSQTFVADETPRQEAASAIDLIYETADGYITAAALTDRQWAGLARAVERPEWLEDERFRTSALRQKNIDARLQLTQEALISRSTSERHMPRTIRTQSFQKNPSSTRALTAMNAAPQSSALAATRRACARSPSPIA